MYVVFRIQLLLNIQFRFYNFNITILIQTGTYLLKASNILLYYFVSIKSLLSTTLLHSVFFIRNLKLRLPKNFLIFEQNLAKKFLKFLNSEKT